MLCPRVYPQLTHTVPRIHKLRQRPVTGVCTAKGSRGRSQSPLVAPAGAKSPCDKKNQVTQEKHTPKSASRKEVMGKNRKFPYRPFYHENPHLKSPKIPPIPCQARHGASKQGCKSAFGTLAAPLILFRHNRNGAVIVRFLVEALCIGCWRTRFGRRLSGRKRAHNGNQGASAYPAAWTCCCDSRALA